MITPKQIRAARALLDWTQEDLAKAAGLHGVSIRNIERGDTDPRVSTMTAIQVALENVGVVFIEEDGVRLGN